MSNEEDRLDAFLAGLDLDTDDDTDDEPDPLDVPSPEPIKRPRTKFMTAEQLFKKIDAKQKEKRSLEVQDEDYGSIAWQKREIGDGVPTKTVDCVVYHYDEGSDFLINPEDLSDIGEWKGEGEDPEWFDEDTHNELKEKYNQNIKKKAGKFNGCY